MKVVVVHCLEYAYVQVFEYSDTVLRGMLQKVLDVATQRSNIHMTEEELERGLSLLQGSAAEIESVYDLQIDGRYGKVAIEEVELTYNSDWPAEV